MRKEAELRCRIEDKETFIKNVEINNVLLQKEADRRQQLRNQYLLGGVDMLSQLQKRESKRAAELETYKQDEAKERKRIEENYRKALEQERKDSLSKRQKLIDITEEDR